MAVAVGDLVVVRGGTNVLHGITASVTRGSVTGLFGPSGCGKSTLMRSIVGVQHVHGGRVHVLGLPAGTASLRRRVSYTTQSPSVYRDLTVRENLEYFARVLGVARSEVDRVIDVVALRERSAALACRLSGGQLSRASLAVALLGSPELLVLDEPTVGLDPVLRRDLWATFRALAGSGVTLLVSSHVLDEGTHCDALILMREGRVLAVDTPAGLLERTGTSDLDRAFLGLIDTAAGRR